MRGRKPLPTHLKVIQGNRGKRPIKPDAIEVAPTLPMPPTFLCDEAKVEWGRVSSMLYALRLLSDLDIAPLAAYCQAYATWQRANTALNKLALTDEDTLGLIAKGANGSSIAHPLLKIANKAAQDMVRFAADFGMTPVARARIHSGEPTKPAENPQEKYFA